MWRMYYLDKTKIMDSTLTQHSYLSTLHHEGCLTDNCLSCFFSLPLSQPGNDSQLGQFFGWAGLSDFRTQPSWVPANGMTMPNICWGIIFLFRKQKFSQRRKSRDLPIMSLAIHLGLCDKEIILRIQIVPIWTCV